MVSNGNFPDSRACMNSPPKIRSFQRAYMRLLISSVTALASAGESLLPISSLSGGMLFPMRRGLKLVTRADQAFLEISSVFIRERRCFPARETFHRQAAELHQLAENAAAVGAQILADHLHQPGEQIVLFLRRLEIAGLQGLVQLHTSFGKGCRRRMNFTAQADRVN